MNKREAGRLGGLATFHRRGPGWMARIGRLGFQATTDRHYGGDRRAHVLALAERGLMASDPVPVNGAWTPEGESSPDTAAALDNWRALVESARSGSTAGETIPY
jgi:hypothetical protein